MSEEQTAKFEGFAIVEIMGHQSCAGHVTTMAFGSVVMFRVVQQEVPATEDVLKSAKYIDGEYIPAGSRVRVSRPRAETYVGAASVYRMTPCTEIEALAVQPLKYEVLEKAARQITSRLETPEDWERENREAEDVEF